MNTQTHLLLSAVLFAPSATSLRGCDEIDPSVVNDHRAARALGAAALAGGLFPDASLYVMWLVATALGVPEPVIWREWYYSESWQAVGAATNSLPLYGAVSLAAVALGGRVTAAAREAPIVASTVLTFSLAALVHVLTDFPLHHDDGRPNFWPFSDWIFRSPVSYWDPAHYGTLWAPIEIALAVVLIVLLWRRFHSHLVRAILLFAIGSYAAVAAYWSNAFG